MKAQTLLKKAPVDLEKTVGKMSMNEREDLRRELEGISERAGQIAGYLDMRHGSGCGDQGHDRAVKEFNRNGKMIWMRVFGYNAYHDINF